MRKLLVSFLLMLLVVSECSQAFSQTTVCNQASADVYYINGVWNFTYADAQSSMLELMNRVQPQLTTDEANNTNFNVSYNPGDGYLTDVLEAAAQSIGTDWAYFWSLIYQIDSAPSWFRAIIQQVAQSGVALSQISPTILQDFVASYHASLNEGRKVVIVSHSQGNLFANGAATYISSTQLPSFGIVAVATPDSYVATSVVPYITLTNDLVINVAAASGRSLLGLSPPLPPDATDTDSSSSGDWSGHAFVASYLQPGSTTESEITSYTLTALRTLVQPNQAAGQGPVTVALTWGGIGDVDLHVGEPDGTQVYYAHKQGTAGYLDVDNTYGYGPEHYYTSCSNTIVGTYNIGVDYYAGSIPQNATVQVSAGDLSRTFMLTLPTADYNSRPPVPAATVQLTKDPTTGEIAATISSPQ